MNKNRIQMWSKKLHKVGILSAVISIMVGVLSGCSLAKVDAGGETAENAKGNADRLVGAFITTEYLDLFDMDAYLNDNIDELVNGGNITVENDSKYHDRLYGVVDKHGSTEPFDWEIRFDGVEGICFFYSEWKEEDEEPFSMLMMGDEICEVTQHLNVTDEGETVKLTGTMYTIVQENVENAGFYFNPVYVTEDGAYYVTSGMGHFVSGDIGGEFTVTLDEEATMTENGESQTYGGGVEVTVHMLQAAPAQISLHYMDEDLNVLHKEAYAIGEVPAQVETVEGTACIVVETKWSDGEITREMYNPEAETTYVESFYKVSEIGLGKKSTEIIWK